MILFFIFLFLTLASLGVSIYFSVKEVKNTVTKIQYKSVFKKLAICLGIYVISMLVMFLAIYQMRNNIDNAYNQARSQNITSLYDNLANVGRENFIMNQLNSNKALLYGLNRLGLSKYVG